MTPTAPNPVFVLRAVLDAEIPLEDERAEVPIELGWLDGDGNATEQGAQVYEWGWVALRDPNEVLTCPTCGLEMPRRRWPVAGWPRLWGRLARRMKAEGTPVAGWVESVDEADDWGLARRCPRGDCDGVVEGAD